MVHVRQVWHLGKGEERELDYTLLGLRGRGTRLSALGAKLLWAGRRAQARLEPELENLATELAHSLHDHEAAGVPVLRVHASHDFTLAGLRRIAADTHKLVLDVRYRGSAEALASLRKGGCDVAGFHVTEGLLGRRAASRYAESLGWETHRLIRLATRVQGLIVARGNPKGIRGIADLARPGVRFINRQRDSGTRILLEELLAATHTAAGNIAGYEDEEHTHAAVAAHVASGLADAGLGIEAAATRFELDFLPIATERYFFAVHREALEKPEVQFLLGLLRGDAFHDTVSEVHGERAHRTGEVSQLKETPPWDALLSR